MIRSECQACIHGTAGLVDGSSRFRGEIIILEQTGLDAGCHEPDSGVQHHPIPPAIWARTSVDLPPVRGTLRREFDEYVPSFEIVEPPSVRRFLRIRSIGPGDCLGIAAPRRNAANLIRRYAIETDPLTVAGPARYDSRDQQSRLASARAHDRNL